MSATKLAVYHLVALSIAAASLWLCYSAITSDPWQRSFNCVRYVREVPVNADRPESATHCPPSLEEVLTGASQGRVRVTYYRATGFILELFRAIGMACLAAWGYLVLSKDARDFWTPSTQGIVRWPFGLKRHEKRLLYLGAFGIAGYHLVAVVRLSQAYPNADRVRDIVLPYLAYLPYSLVTYLMFGLPLTFVFLRSATEDGRVSREYTLRLKEMADIVTKTSPDTLAFAFADYLREFHDYGSHRARTAGRYLLFMAVVQLYFVYELLTTTYLTLTTASLDWLKTIVWLLLLLALMGAIQVIQRYQSQRGRALTTVRVLMKRASDAQSVALQKQGREAEMELGQGSTLQYLWKIAMGGGLLSIMLQAIGIAVSTAIRARTTSEAVQLFLPGYAGRVILWLIDLLSPVIR